LQSTLIGPRAKFFGFRSFVHRPYSLSEKDTAFWFFWTPSPSAGRLPNASATSSVFSWSYKYAKKE
jgi:hypothetical protein